MITIENFKVFSLYLTFFFTQPYIYFKFISLIKKSYDGGAYEKMSVLISFFISFLFLLTINILIVAADLIYPPLIHLSSMLLYIFLGVFSVFFSAGTIFLIKLFEKKL